jgi:hypothetical protein
MTGTTSDASCSSRGISWSFCLLLILILTSSSGCPKQPPMPQDLKPMLACQKWNREELTGFYSLVQIAQRERLEGDPGFIAAAVERMGAMLTRCGILTRVEEPDAE